MSEGDGRMTAVLMVDTPPARDAAFEIAVLERIERRRFHRAVLERSVLALAATLVLGLVMAPLQPVWQAGLAVAGHMLPQGPSMELVLGLVLMAASAALSVWRRAP